MMQSRVSGFFEASSARGPAAFLTPSLLFTLSSHPPAAAALLAQIKFDSVILEVITVASAVAFVGRVTLSYKRLNDRWVALECQPVFDLFWGEGPVCLAACPSLPTQATPDWMDRGKEPTAQS